MIANQILLGFEEDGKCGVTPKAGKLIPYLLCLDSDTMQASKGTEKRTCINRKGRDSFSFKVNTGMEISGALGYTDTYEQIGLYYKMLMGKPDTKDNGDGTFTHLFSSSSEACLPCAWLQHAFMDCDDGTGKAKDNLTEIFNGVRASAYSSKLSATGVVESSVNLVAGTYNDNIIDTTLVKVGETNMIDFSKIGLTPIDTCDAFIKLGTGGDLKTLADFDSLTEFSISIDNKIDPKKLFGNGNCKNETCSTGVSVNGTLSAVWDLDMYKKLSSTSDSSYSVSIGYVDKSTPVNKIEYIFGKIELDFKSIIPTKECVVIEAGYEAVHGKGKAGEDTATIKIALTNRVPAYN